MMFPYVPPPYGWHAEPSRAWQLPDLAKADGSASEALQHRLAESDLLKLEDLLEARGIVTFGALMSMDENERQILLEKSKQLYDLLNKYPRDLDRKLENLFSDRCGAADYNYVGTQQPQQRQWYSPQPPLVAPKPDDCRVKRELYTKLAEARMLLGEVRYNECLRQLAHSHELQRASKMAAARAYAAACIAKE